MSKVSKDDTLTAITQGLRDEEAPPDERAPAHWSRSFESDDLEDLSAVLRDPSLASRTVAILELLEALRNELAHASRVLVSLTPVQVSGAELERRQAVVSELVEQMTPELEVPSEPQMVQARRNAEARTQLLQEFGALSGEQIGEEHSRAENRHALAARWRKEGRILGVTYKGQILYPAFQFGDDGRPLSIIRNVLNALPRDRMSEWEVALWWTAANGWLGDQRPVDQLGDPSASDALVGAATRLAERPPL